MPGFWCAMHYDPDIYIVYATITPAQVKSIKVACMSTDKYSVYIARPFLKFNK